MKRIEIQAKPFFEKIKGHNLSMWDMMAQMMGQDEKEIIFLDENGKLIFRYILPNTLEQLKKDQKEFAQILAEKIAQSNPI